MRVCAHSDLIVAAWRAESERDEARWPTAVKPATSEGLNARVGREGVASSVTEASMAEVGGLGSRKAWEVQRVECVPQPVIKPGLHAQFELIDTVTEVGTDANLQACRND